MKIFFGIASNNRMSSFIIEPWNPWDTDKCVYEKSMPCMPDPIPCKKCKKWDETEYLSCVNAIDTLDAIIRGESTVSLTKKQVRILRKNLKYTGIIPK